MRDITSPMNHCLQKAEPAPPPPWQRLQGGKKKHALVTCSRIPHTQRKWRANLKDRNSLKIIIRELHRPTDIQRHPRINGVNRRLVTESHDWTCIQSFGEFGSLTLTFFFFLRFCQQDLSCLMSYSCWMTEAGEGPELCGEARRQITHQSACKRLANQNSALPLTNRGLPESHHDSSEGRARTILPGNKYQMKRL